MSAWIESVIFSWPVFILLMLGWAVVQWLWFDLWCKEFLEE